jgi:recombination protein RecA
MIDLGVLHGLVEKSGAWYAYNGNKIGQGKANAAKFLAENPDWCRDREADPRQAVESRCCR